MNKIYIFDIAHYLNWCKKWDLPKNNTRVLQLFKARCDYEIQLAKTKKAIAALRGYENV